MGFEESLVQNVTGALPQQDEDYFSGLLENNAWKNISLLISCFGVIAFPLVLYSIIWFEKYGNDTNRTLLNMFASLYCWALLEFIILVQISETARFLFGPLPGLVCYIQLFLRNSLVTVLFKNFMAATKYVFVFWLKNPAAFGNEYWCLFICIWSYFFSLVLRTIEFAMSSKMSINYFICAGIKPFEEKNGVHILNGKVEIFSIILNIFVNTRVYFYKKGGEKRYSDSNR